MKILHSIFFRFQCHRFHHRRGREDPSSIAFIQAAESNDIETLRILHQHGIDIHLHHDMALRHAAKGGNLQVVRYLVEECDANVHAVHGQALCWAMMYGHTEVVHYLSQYYHIQNMGNPK